MKRAATPRPFLHCLQSIVFPLKRLPHALFTSVPGRLVFSVYLGTYATANSLDTIVNFVKSAPPEKINTGTTKFAGVALVSTALTVYKDGRMARYFGAATTAKAATPAIAYSLFTMRDAITIFASFNLPTMLAPRLEELPPKVKEKFGTLLQSEAGRFKTAQFMLPAAIQLVTTPIHLLGLDTYNRQGRLGIASRFTRVARDVGVAIPARVVRIVPAFGMGGVVNANMRRKLIAGL